MPAPPLPVQISSVALNTPLSLMWGPSNGGTAETKVNYWLISRWTVSHRITNVHKTLCKVNDFYVWEKSLKSGKVLQTPYLVLGSIYIDCVLQYTVKRFY